MRITIVQGAFLPVPPIMGGAVEKVWFAMGREFARRGNKVTHISRCHPALQSEETLDGVRHLRIPGFNAPRSVLQLKLMDLIYSLRVLRHLPPADILVTNTFWLPVLIRNDSRGKVYVHVARFPKGQMRFYSHVARLQTVSRSVAAAIRQEVPELQSKIGVIPYPLPEEESDGNAPEPKAKEILFVGRIHPEKGVHLLILAMIRLVERFPGWRLVLVGPEDVRFGGGGTDYLYELRRLAEPISNYVTWVGPVFSAERLAALYRQASIFVYPSLAEKGETFGLAPLEAMSHGCVPIVSGLHCFRDYISPEVNGFVFDHNAPDPQEILATALAGLCGNPEDIASTSKAARETASKFNLSRIASLCLDDFASLLGKRAGMGVRSSAIY